MIAPATIKAEGMILAIVGIGIVGLLLMCLLLILIALFFGKGPKDMIDLFQLVASLLLFLLPSFLMAKIGIKRWKSGKINAEDQSLIISSFKSFR